VAGLSGLTTLRLGGPAGTLIEATTEEAVVEAVRAAGEDALVLGGGSNVVVCDAGWPGTVIRVATRGVARDGETLDVQAGEPWDPLVAMTVREGLAGFECLSGIPGSTGATPIQNVGAYGQEVAETITAVRVYDREADAVVELPAAECGFAYRRSRFKGSSRWIVLAVRFAMEESEVSMPIRYVELARALGVPVGGRAPLEEVRAAVLALRRGKGMVIDPEDPDSVSAGSFFTNPVVDLAVVDEIERRAGARPPTWPQPDGSVKTSAAWLIERSGFAKGYGAGRAGISTKHTLALVNRGGATCAELVGLAREIAGGVRERFGVELVPEPVFVGLRW
jgi:UDP-N-acetylmuramate dehydrogenase